ncbi:hypothetical protein LUZ60_017641 [Juncus effusus]|nr:hypothetical protein LUZ60_017641 [Juncus effusus]
MNFLYRTQPVVPEVPSVQVQESDLNKDLVRKSSGTLEGLIATEDPFPGPGPGETDSDGPADLAPDRPASRNELPACKHADVAEGEGWITIPNKELPDDWNEVSDISELKSLDRSFIFPGEQVHILVCFSPSKDSELISPFKSAPSISKNGKSIQIGESNGDSNGSLSPPIISQTETILQKFKNSSFFVRIAEPDDPLWSRKKRSQTGNSNSCNVVSDKGFFDGVTAGGVARDSARCFSLRNGDIVVLLCVNVGVTNQIPEQSLEILQFEKHESPNHNSDPNDPYGNLLTWLLPLERTLNPKPPRSLSPPVNLPTVSHKPSFSASSTSQIFSFGNFRSYSMPTTVTPTSVTPTTNPPTVTPPTVTPTTVTASPYDLEEFDSVALEMSSGKAETERLSFRGVQLETERYSVRCGLEGIYLPGKRWKKSVEIVQPVEVRSFAAKCTTENLLCVQVKNVAPEHLSDVVIYIDAITIVFEEASNTMPLSLPISSIESGDGYSLPNLALRRNEEHSFIVKPATNATNLVSKSKIMSSSVSTDQYAVLVSYRCNYSESKLFFKQTTSWRPSVARDVMISVSSEPCNQAAVGQSTRVPQLPVQVLTLEATNLTAEDLTLTVLAPEPSASSPSVLALNAAPATNLAASSFSTASSPNEASASCTHLWLQSAVPLGCVPAQSSATVKLELLPLTDGIITLNTLQITIKEKGLTYVPEHSLEIYATSSISTGIS